MNYPLKNSPFSSSRNKRNRYARPLQICAAVIVLLILMRLALPNAFDSLFSVIFAPLWRMENAAGADDFFATHASLVSQNALLKEQLADLAPADASIALLQQENAELKTMLGRAQAVPDGGDFILAAVLTTAPLSSYDGLIVDIGSNKKIKAGDRVFAIASPVDVNAGSSAVPAPVTASSSATSTEATSTDEVLAPIGTVSEVTAETAKVGLFSAPGSQYAVQIGKDHIPATAVSQGGGMFNAELAQGSSVSVGDAVTVPDIETLVFGSVGGIVNDPAHPYMDVLFREPVNIYELRWVLIEKESAI